MNTKDTEMDEEGERPMRQEVERKKPRPNRSAKMKKKIFQE